MNSMDELLIGKVFDGKYQIETVLGKGGMGTVYKAKDLTLQRRVAIKMIRPERIDVEYVKRFFREAQATKLLCHKNLVQYYNFCQTSEHYCLEKIFYLVLEYLDGHTLREELVNRKTFSAQEALAVLSPIADVLDFAHSKGIIHRDLKPENILLSHSPQGMVVKLLDLGIAKITDAELSALTKADQPIGTPRYMPPEQWGLAPEDGLAKMDGRTDLYSLAAIIFELIAGRPVFDGQTFQALLGQHINVEPPLLHKIVPNIPVNFSKALVKALSKERQHRQNSCGQLFRELNQALNQASQDARASLNSPNNLMDTLATVSVTRESEPIASHTPIPIPIPEITPKPRKEVKSNSFPKRMIFGSITTIVVSLLVLFTTISFSKSPVKQTELMSVPVPSSELIADTPADADTSELINYFVETTLKPNTESKGTKQIGSIELKSGAGFRFHFSAQQSGHLYIIGTGANNHQTTFLTDKPTADSGVTTNLINVHQDYSFPSNNWITLGNIPGVESYTLLFTSKPINLDFLQAKAGHTLSSKEVEKLIQFLATTRKPLTKLFTDREQTACLQVPKEKFSETISFSISINHE